MSLILVIIIFLIIFGGGGSIYAHNYYGLEGLGFVLGVIFIVLIVMWILDLDG